MSVVAAVEPSSGFIKTSSGQPQRLTGTVLQKGYGEATSAA